MSNRVTSHKNVNLRIIYQVCGARRFASRAAYAARYARSGKKSTKSKSNYAKRTEVHDRVLHSFFVIVVANWRLDNAKGPAAMLQEKNARKPHTLRVADVVRT